MEFFKRWAGLIASLLLAIAITVIPRYWQLGMDSIATLVDYDIPVAIANEVADLIKPVFNVRKLRFGNPFRLEKESDGTLKAFEYKIDDESVLKVAKGTESYEAKVEKLDLEFHEATITAEIHNS